jgi:serine protease Do
VSRGWLGVLIQEVNRDLAESFGLERPRGALVAEVMTGSPAQEAGLEAGDIVLTYDGEEVALSSDLPPMVGRTLVGETAELSVLRGGKVINVDVEIGRLPQNGQAGQAAPSDGSDDPSSSPLGLSIEPVPDEIADALELSSGGVLVTEVAPGSARNAGIRVNDVITELNRQAVGSVEDFRKVVKSLPDNSAVSVRVVRQGRASYFVMKP